MFVEDELKDFDFEELDNEIGLGELLKQKDNFFVALFKKVIFGILVILIGIMVFYASFTIGKVLFLSDNTVPLNPQEEGIIEPTIAPQVVSVNPIVKEAVVTEVAPVVATPATVAPVTVIKTTTPVKTETIKPIAVKQLPAPVKPVVIKLENKVEVKPTVQTTVQPVAVAKPASTSGTTYSLVAGTFGQMENAKKLQNSISLHGYSPEIKTIVRNDKTLYRVIAATFTSLEKANITKKALDSAGIDSFLESYPAK